jgi:hypothetical protein
VSVKKFSPRYRNLENLENLENLYGHPPSVARYARRGSRNDEKKPIADCR